MVQELINIVNKCRAILDLEPEVIDADKADPMELIDKINALLDQIQELMQNKGAELEKLKQEIAVLELQLTDVSAQKSI